MKLVPESLNEILSFERKQSKLSSLGVGLVSKRIFKNVLDAANWAYQFPEAYTEGKITEWPKNIEWYKYNNKNPLNFHSIFVADNIQKVTGSISTVKWFKDNIKFDYDSNERIGLKDAKDIFDTLKEIIWNNLDINK